MADILKNLDPVLNEGSYVFVTVKNTSGVPRNKVVGEFKEKEGSTLILEQETADELDLNYEFIAAWITLNVHSSLHAVGLTAKVSQALSKNNIACNCIAGYYHDHLFVPIKYASDAIIILRALGT